MASQVRATCLLPCLQIGMSHSSSCVLASVPEAVTSLEPWDALFGICLQLLLNKFNKLPVSTINSILDDIPHILKRLFQQLGSGYSSCRNNYWRGPPQPTPTAATSSSHRLPQLVLQFQGQVALVTHDIQALTRRPLGIPKLVPGMMLS